MYGCKGSPSHAYTDQSGTSKVCFSIRWPPDTMPTLVDPESISQVSVRQVEESDCHGPLVVPLPKNSN